MDSSTQAIAQSALSQIPSVNAPDENSAASRKEALVSLFQKTEEWLNLKVEVGVRVGGSNVILDPKAKVGHRAGNPNVLSYRPGAGLFCGRSGIPARHWSQLSPLELPHYSSLLDDLRRTAEHEQNRQERVSLGVQARAVVSRPGTSPIPPLLQATLPETTPLPVVYRGFPKKSEIEAIDTPADTGVGQDWDNPEDLFPPSAADTTQKNPLFPAADNPLLQVQEALPQTSNPAQAFPTFTDKSGMSDDEIDDVTGGGSEESDN